MSDEKIKNKKKLNLVLETHKMNPNSSVTQLFQNVSAVELSEVSPIPVPLKNYLSKIYK